MAIWEGKDRQGQRHFAPVYKGPAGGHHVPDADTDGSDVADVVISREESLDCDFLLRRKIVGKETMERPSSAF